MPRGDSLVHFTSEKAREAGKKGGPLAAKKKKENNTLRAELIKILNMEDASGVTNREKVTMSLFRKAMLEGDVAAFNSLRDTIGEKPTDKVISDTKINIAMKGLEELSE
jgi:hypothetical protein